MRIAAAAARPPASELPDLARRAGQAGADLLMLPEAPADARPELSDGETARLLGEAARSGGIALLSGYVEQCITGVYSAALLVDRRGVSIANYRQAHVRPGDLERRERGHWLTIMPLEGMRLGLMIGYDLEFPEAARAVALAGCDLLAVIGGTTDSMPHHFHAARARENRCWLAYAGPDPCLIGPDGAMRATAGPDGIAIGEVDSPPPVATRPEFAADRRPRLYEALVHGVEEDARPE
jgi:predicted amidohydrolase